MGKLRYILTLLVKTLMNKRQALTGFTSQKQLKATIAKLYKMWAKPASGVSEEELFERIVNDSGVKKWETVWLTLQEDLTYLEDTNYSEVKKEFDFFPPEYLSEKTPLRKRFTKTKIDPTDNLIEILEKIVNMRRKKSFKEKFIKFSGVFVLSLMLVTFWTALINVAYQTNSQAVIGIVTALIVSIIIYIWNSDSE